MMNWFRVFFGVGTLSGGAVVAQARGCIVPANLDDCNVYAHAGCSGGTSSTSTGTTTSTRTGAGGHPSCDAAMGAVDGSCGVFVSSSKGDDKNDGSPGKPLATLGAALSKAGAGG